MKKKQYTKKQKKVVKKYWSILKEYMDGVYQHIRFIEEGMRIETGIKDIEFIKLEHCPFCLKELFEDWDYFGVGTAKRDYPLLQGDDLK